MYTPREHQDGPLDKWVSWFHNNPVTVPLIIEACGSGKSHLIAFFLERAKARALILQPRKELVKQNHGKYIDHGYKAGIYCASLGRKEIEAVTFATAASFAKVAEKYKGEFDVLIVDECFPYKTPVATSDGSMYIGDIVKKIKKGEDVLVKSFNELTRSFEYKKVTNAFVQGKKELVKVKLSNTSIKCTPNHPILTIRGWVSASDIKKSDHVVTSYSHDNKGSFAQLNTDQSALFVGSILGDGSIDYRSPDNSIGRIKFIQGQKQQEYLRFKSGILKREQMVRRIEKNGYAQTPAFTFNSMTCYLPENMRSYESCIQSLCPKSLAILWQDDGNLTSKQNGGSIYTLGLHEPLVRALCTKLLEMGITGVDVRKGKSSSSKKDLWYISFKKESVNCISKLIAPYVHPSMSYKVVDSEKHKVGTHIWDNEFLPNVKPVKSVERLDGIENVYDIEVLDNHNFVVIPPTAYAALNYNLKNKRDFTNDGVVVHNCHRGSKQKSQIDKIQKALGGIPMCGLTASPIVNQYADGDAYFVMMDQAENNIFNDIISVTQISTLVELGYWCPIDYDIKRVNQNALKAARFNKIKGDYSSEQLDKFFIRNNLTQRIIDCVSDNRDRKSRIIFVPSIAYAEELSGAIPKSAHISSHDKPKDRDKKIELFKAGKLITLINCDIVGIGFDHRPVDHIIQARPTKSFNNSYQNLGRGVRPWTEEDATKVFPAKENVLISCFSGNHSRFGPLETITFEQNSLGRWGMYQDGKIMTVASGKVKKPKDIGKLTYGLKRNKLIKDQSDKYLLWLHRKPEKAGARHIKCYAAITAELLTRGLL